MYLTHMLSLAATGVVGSGRRARSELLEFGRLPVEL
jgi:hypothetical protein